MSGPVTTAIAVMRADASRPGPPVRLAVLRQRLAALSKGKHPVGDPHVTLRDELIASHADALMARPIFETDEPNAPRYRAALAVDNRMRALLKQVAALAFAAILPLVQGRDGIEAHRKEAEKRLVALARTLPVASFVEDTRGVGLLSLAAIVGEAGDLSGYATLARLWKRMGLAVMGDGMRQRRIGGVEALDHGYSPARCSVMWNVGACIVKAGGPLKAVYDARKAIGMPRCEASAADPAWRARYARGGRYAPRAHAHNRAQQYVEKRFLRSLWQAWVGSS